MSITDELRKWAEGDTLRAGMSLRTAREQALAIADRIDKQHEHELTMARGEAIQYLGSEVAKKYVKLPVDADGIPIHVGDEVIDYCTPRTVAAVSEDSICLSGYEEGCYYRMGIAKNYHRTKPDTWERIIADAIAEGYERINLTDTITESNDELIARCKKLAEEESHASA